MTTQISNGTGVVTGTWAAITAVKWNRVDTAAGTTAIPTPIATGTNFSFVKTLQMEITAVAGLNMTALSFGKVAAETTTGTKLWNITTHTTYVQATAAPTATGDNNVSSPTINTTSGVATPINTIAAPAAAYGAGPFNTAARQGNLVEICLGIDFTNVTAGTTVATPTLRFVWSEG